MGQRLWWEKKKKNVPLTLRPRRWEISKQLHYPGFWSHTEWQRMEMKVTREEMMRNWGRWPYKGLKYLRWLIGAGAEGATRQEPIHKTYKVWGAEGSKSPDRRHALYVRTAFSKGWINASLCCVCLLLSRVWFLQPHRLWPAMFLCPWDSPGKNTGVACQFSRVAMGN